MVFLDEVNHRTVSNAVVKVVGDYKLHPNDILTFVSDNAAYCKKAYNTVLKTLYPRSIHICCLAHILHLVGEVFHTSFKKLSEFANLFKSAFFKKGARKRRYLKFMASKGHAAALAPVPTSTRWNSFLKAATYHVSHFSIYLEFFEAERDRSRPGEVSVAIDKLCDLLSNSAEDLKIEALFVATECQKIGSLIDYFQASTYPLSLTAWGKIEELDTFLHKGTAKVIYAPELQELLGKISNAQKAVYVQKFHDVFGLALLKYSKHVDDLPARELYKQVRIFDPKQVSNLSEDIDDYAAIHFRLSDDDDTDVDTMWKLHEEWGDYQNFVRSKLGQEAVSESKGAVPFWQSYSERFPILSATASAYMSVPVSSCDAERSFSIYKHVMNDRRERNTAEHVKMLVMLSFNGDLTSQLVINTKPAMR